MKIELEAIHLAIKYFSGRGYRVEDVSRKQGHNGYDLIAASDAERMKIEVKGCSRAWQIPDLFSTEFDEGKRLVADYLCVVYFIADDPPKLCLIPREAISPDDVQPKSGYRISSRFKKQAMLEKYIRPL